MERTLRTFISLCLFGWILKSLMLVFAVVKYFGLGSSAKI